MSAYSVNIHLVIRYRSWRARSTKGADREEAENAEIARLAIFDGIPRHGGGIVVNCGWQRNSQAQTRDTKREIIESRGRREMKELSERVLSRQGKPRIIDMQRQFAPDNCASRWLSISANVALTSRSILELYRSTVCDAILLNFEFFK